MTLSVKFSVVVAAVLLAACSKPDAQVPPAPAGGGCTPGNCKVVVTVTSCTNITASPDPLLVGHANDIQWEFAAATPGYSFPANGIVFSDPQFVPKPGVTGNGKKFIVNDRHTSQGSFKYDVTVVPDGGGSPCTVDPRITNN